MNEYQDIKRRREERRKALLEPKKKTKNIKIPRFILSFISRLFVTAVLTLIVFITLKTNKNLKSDFYREVYEKNFSFTTVNSWYQKTFGSPIPFQDFFHKTTEPVFQETLKYQEKNKYLDGVSLKVDQNYLVPSLESGLVVFIGEKEGYGNTVIVQQMNGIDLWYGNMKEVNAKLYDYIEKGSLLGEASESNLYLIFKKEGKVLDYNDYL